MLLIPQCNDNEGKVNCNIVFKFSVSSFFKTEIYLGNKKYFYEKNYFENCFYCICCNSFYIMCKPQRMSHD